MATEKTTEVTKVDANTFDVAESITVTRRVDKKQLKAEIDELQLTIDKIKQQTGLDGLKKELDEKKELLASLK